MIILITGSSGLIGTYLKNEFLKNPENQIIEMDLHSEYPVDATKEEEVQKYFEKISGEYEYIDLLVNCIGIPNSANKLPFKDITEVTTDSFRQLIDVNLSAVFIICKEFVKAFGDHSTPPQPPKIVNISSLYSLVSPRLDLYGGNIKHPGYTASKHGLVGLTKNLAILLAERGISVNCIAPAAVAETVGVNSKFLEQYNEQVPMKRPVRMQEIYNAIEYIIKCANVTGQNLIIDGGYSLW